MSKDRLRAGEVLQQGEFLTSPNGRYRFTNYAKRPFELEVLNPNYRLFGLNSDQENIKLCVQDDGNVVLYTTSNKALWSTKTDHQGNKNTVLIVRDDGNLVVECDGKGLWNSRTRVTDQLNVGETFDRGIMASPNGKIRLIQEDRDGRGYLFNLVLKDETGKTLWTENTHGSYQFDLRAYDNLIGTDHEGHGTTFWSTGTKNPRPSRKAVFQVLDEGAAVLRAKGKTLWSTDRARYPPAPLDPEDWTVSPGDKAAITWGESLNPGQSITSANDEFSAVFREDGNWVVVYNPTQADVWSVQVTEPGALKMCMDYDNHFFSFDRSGKVSDRTLDVNTQALHIGVVTYSNGCPVKLDNDGHLYSYEGGNRGWDVLDRTFPWCNRLWFPVSKDKKTSQLFPGQCLAAGQFLSTTRGADSVNVKYGLNEAGDFILVIGDKTTYFPTGPHAAKIQYLKFTRKELQLIGAGGKVLWKKSYSEPHGFNLSEKDADPAKLTTEFYGDLVVNYKGRLLWNVYDLKQSDSPSPVP